MDEKKKLILNYRLLSRGLKMNILYMYIVLFLNWLGDMLEISNIDDNEMIVYIES